MKKYALLFFVLISFSGYAQNTINNYKYVLVPEKFSFLKQANQYRLNTLAKALLEEKGFTVYYDNSELPQEIANNKCTALNVEVLEKKSMFSTNLTLLLKDCQNNVVFKSKEGKSREKEFSTSYNLALRDAFTSLEEVPYAYVAGNNEVKTAIVTVAPPVPPASSVPATQTAAPVALPAAASVVPVVNASGTLYAQATANGYQLIDTTPKKVLTLFKTSVQDCFIADNGTANGIVLKKNGEWYFEYYKDGSLTAEKLSIKF
ncbi:hypothetical protein [Pedobacter nyackensis]|uniref:hypothetical protein n=1 Tax=Pedobacter nyackensis TaxID=475255 RepID=UPI00292F6F61|nr:hypothetical protein [Pedobacter nyackensis]